MKEARVMRNRLLGAVLLVLLLGLTCFAQSTYKGLTPGQSTRADAERSLGQPIKELSKTLIEYKSPEAAARLYVQYSDESPAAIVERIELACLTDKDGTYNQCCELGQLGGVLNDAFSVTTKQDGPAHLSAHRVEYYSAPRFIVLTTIIKGFKPEMRKAFYSKELYESVVPKGGCTGTIFGTWATERGRVTIVRVGDNGIRGTYAKNNGSFSLKQVRGGYMGEWKDSTGSGTMALMFRSLPPVHYFEASLSRGAGDTASSKPPPARSEADARIQAIQALIGEIKKSGGAAVGETIESSEPDLNNTGLPPGEPLTGKCIP
jgi:hypothetical protein